MKKIIYITLIFFSITELSAQTEWTVQNPYPTYENLYTIDFINDLTGFAGGENFTLLKTTNGGNNWNVRKIFVEYYSNIISQIDFQNENTGYILFSSGSKLFKTTNGGINFININTPIEGNSGSQIKFINTETGFILDNKLYKTLNGGLNWIQINLTDSLSVNDLKIKNGLMHILCYNFLSNRYYYGVSNDLGNTISYKLIHFYDPYYKIQKLDVINNYIYAFATDFFNEILLKSSDNGLTWDIKPISSAHYFNDLLFFNDTTGIMIFGSHGGSGKIKRTTNGGNTWEDYYYDGNPNFSFLQFCQINNNEVYVCGTTGLLMKSNNEGADWIELSKRVTSHNLNSISFKNANTGLIVGDNGTVIRTSNGGELWEKINLQTKKNFNKVFLFDDGIGYITGDTGGYYKSANDGISWEFFDMSVYGKKFYGSFINSRNGCITGGDSLKMVMTTNGGNTWNYKLIPMGWTQYLVGRTTDFENVTCVGTNKFIAIQTSSPWHGSGATTLFYTTNSGLIWSGGYTSCQGYGFGSISTSIKDSDFVYWNGWCSGGNNYGKITYNFFGNTESATGNSSKISFWNKYYGVSSEDEGIKYTTNSGIKWYMINPYFKGFFTPYLADSTTAYFISLRGRIVKVNNINTLVNITSSNSIIENFILYQNYPNPFNPTTYISFTLKKNENVKLNIYDIKGSLIKSLINERLHSGSHKFEFNGNSLSSGIYFYKLETEGFQQTKKMILIK